jgi:nucleoside-diphosphate-sugar epimerase
MRPFSELSGKTVLVTGAAGFLGSRLVAVLAELGCAVHALVRKTSRTETLSAPGVTLFVGDVANASSLLPAFQGVDLVVHAAADTSGTEQGGKLSTVQGTANVLALSQRHQVKKLVHISSCNVYGVADFGSGELVTEASSLEKSPEKRGPYTAAKLEAEGLVLKALEQESLPIVCLRPGTIYGPGGALYTPMLGFSLYSRIFAVIGDGSLVLPLVYVDNLVEAILCALTSEKDGVYNVVDPERVTKRQYMEGVIKELYPNALTLYLPYPLLKLAVAMQEMLLNALKRRPFLTSYRLISSQREVIYDVSKISRDLSWTPPVTVSAAYRNLISYERSRT